MSKIIGVVLFASFLVVVLSGTGCAEGEVIIKNKCTLNDVSPPRDSTTTFHGTTKIRLEIGAEDKDSSFLDFLITVTSVDSFFLVFSDTYTHSDVIMFNLSNSNGDYVLNTVDSFF